MKLLVCGGRDYMNEEATHRALDAVHRKHGITLVIDGAAPEADTHAFNWARKNGVLSMRFPAPWKALGGKAGPIRNDAMIKHGDPDAAVAMPGGKGTSDMVRKLEKHSIPVWRPIK